MSDVVTFSLFEYKSCGDVRGARGLLLGRLLALRRIRRIRSLVGEFIGGRSLLLGRFLPLRCLVGVGVADASAANVITLLGGISSLNGCSRLVECRPSWVPCSDDDPSIDVFECIILRPNGRNKECVRIGTRRLESVKLNKMK